MSNMGDKIRERRALLGISQVALAKTAGCSQTTISDIERGRNECSKELPDIARALNVTVEYLLGTPRRQHIDAPSNTGPERRSIVKVPLISSIRAGAMCGSPDLYQPGDAEEWVETTARVSAYSYALRVVGDSMTNPHGSPSIPEGSIVIIDPQAEALPGKIVVVKVKGEDDATLKRFVKDGPQYYLRALNPAYPMIPYDKERYVICGVAKQVIQEL